MEVTFIKAEFVSEVVLDSFFLKFQNKTKLELSEKLYLSSAASACKTLSDSKCR